jgi:uncharacterized protein
MWPGRACRPTPLEVGDANAQTDLGDFYRGGKGVGQDYAMARFWYERAAAQGQRNAAFHLGSMDWSGLGAPIDLEGAGRWMEKAYATGREDAAFFVGLSNLRRAVPNAPSGPVDLDLLAEAKPWFETAMREDPDEERRAAAAATLAQIRGYEAMGRAQTDR